MQIKDSFQETKSKLWYGAKGTLFFGIVSIAIFIWFIISAVALHADLIKINKTVSDIHISTWKGTNLTLKCLNDNNIYYQTYKDKFQDNRATRLKIYDRVSFFTTTRKMHIDRPILAPESFNEFDYYPIFSVNNNKSFIHILFFVFSQNSWLNIIFYFSSAATFFSLIPYITVTTWPKRIVLLIIAGIWSWIFLL